MKWIARTWDNVYMLIYCRKGDESKYERKIEMEFVVFRMAIM